VVICVTIVSDRSAPAGQAPAYRDTPALPAALEQADLWADAVVAGAGIPVHDAAFVSVGGGMGSFITVDYLRVAGGVPTSEIRVLSNITYPWQTYQYLAGVSQIPRTGRIRSDSSSRPDNLWGFPSYALQEAVRDATLKPLLQVFLEPVFADYYTPRLGMVLDSMAREANRIRYDDMLVRGEVLLTRRRVGGGYYALLAPAPGVPVTSDAVPAPLVAFRCRDIHIAPGYAGLKFLPDLQDFRQRYNFHHVVNAYEDHEHVYEALRLRPGTVLVRGAGVVASQVLERLIRDRLDGGSPTRIVHLFRTFVDGSHGPHAWSRRRGRHGFAYQGFNYPKSVWGGQLKSRVRRLENADRARAYEEIGGTTTPWRRGWQSHLAQGREAGWYRTQSGTIEELRMEDGAVVARLQVPEGELEVRADYMIDCTGLEGDVAEHRVLRDLLEHGGARRNPLGRMDVDRSFQLRGAASGDGRAYVTGAASYGGYFPGVDTFLGLQISAQEVVDDMARRGRCRHLGPLRSTAEWLKWVSGRTI